MSEFEKAEEYEIEAAMARAAGYELELIDPGIPEMGWQRIPASDLSPNIRHINRTRNGIQWLGAGITKPGYIRENDGRTTLPPAA